MTKERRHAGRAIRKARREQREAIAAIAAIDLTGLIEMVGEAFANAARVIVDAFAQLAHAITEYEAQQFRMAHRALTTGKEAT